MAKFEDLDFKAHSYFGGKLARIFFENGYGASVVCSDMSYGGREGLYEIAVLNSEGAITYDTPITSDVIGYLSHDQVTEVLYQIETLPKKEGN